MYRTRYNVQVTTYNYNSQLLSIPYAKNTNKKVSSRV